jgi:hypothetical protein
MRKSEWRSWRAGGSHHADVKRARVAEKGNETKEDVHTTATLTSLNIKAQHSGHERSL